MSRHSSFSASESPPPKNISISTSSTTTAKTNSGPLDESTLHSASDNFSSNQHLSTETTVIANTTAAAPALSLSSNESCDQQQQQQQQQQQDIMTPPPLPFSMKGLKASTTPSGIWSTTNTNSNTKTNATSGDSGVVIANTGKHNIYPNETLKRTYDKTIEKENLHHHHHHHHHHHSHNYSNHQVPSAQYDLPGSPLKKQKSTSGPTTATGAPNSDKASQGKCYRHNSSLYMHESENTRRELQQTLKSLSQEDQEAISQVWSKFASAKASNRLLMLRGIINLSCVPQLSYLNQTIPKLLRIDFISSAPPEIAFRILSFLDAKSLCTASQVSRRWARFANDDYLWYRLCVQHINKVCKSCGWGLPLLDKSNHRRLRPPVPPLHHNSNNAGTNTAGTGTAATTTTSAVPGNDDTSNTSVVINNPVPVTSQTSISSNASTNSTSASVNSAGGHGSPTDTTATIHTTCVPSSASELLRPVPSPPPNLMVPMLDQDHNLGATPSLIGINSPLAAAVRPDLASGGTSVAAVTGAPKYSKHGRRPWKEIYAERQIIANNWRHFRYKKKTFKTHNDGILCMQTNDQYLITGCYDGTVNVTDVETGETIHTLYGHTAPVRALQFDDCKLFTGSLDGTVRIWCYHNGECVRTLTAFEDSGVISLTYKGPILAVGGQNGEIRVFNTTKGTVFSLNGHTDWINCVRFIESPDGRLMLLSCSDDMSIKAWDLTTRRCIATLTGHTHHVQWIHLLDQLHTHTTSVATAPTAGTTATGTASNNTIGINNNNSSAAGGNGSETRKNGPYVISASLDNTLRVWDLSTNECVDTLFGHVEGIWSVALDTLRTVSASNDGIIKIWDTTSRKCLYTLKPSNVPINCVALCDTRVICGDNDGIVSIYDFRNN